MVDRDLLEKAKQLGYGRGKLSETLGISVSKARKLLAIINHEKQDIKRSYVDKKEAEVDWESWVDMFTDYTDLTKKASTSNDKGTVELVTDLPYIIIQPFGDLHLGSGGVDYRYFKDFTNGVLDTPELMLCLLGDMVDGFVNFKNMLAVHQQIVAPYLQDEIFTDWLRTVEHKVLFSTFDNHSIFEERSTGKNAIKKIQSENLMYFNGMGQANIIVNDIEYRIVCTHKTTYNSSFNRTHGLKQMSRKQIQGGDIYMAGHIHTPAMEVCFEHGQDQIFVMIGTLKVNDGFAKRFFDAYCSSIMPCIVLDTKRKHMIPFWELNDAIKFVRGA
jgi:UDP-2,3-diacylglucosamine pyrophosphatase LpxH